ncbi:amidase signature enzyme [Mycena albidolilacea]|uniref:Amidase signature enzyme n=1 Tax=Mycena albidolilacea TaxID=1033008 RepID=A0AAD7AED2_9AGAR|nr:amidase signature enzyme [Mycena albidolilacea]
MAAVRGWLSFALIVFCAHLVHSFSLPSRGLLFGSRQKLETRAAALPDLYEATLAQLQAGLDASQFTSVHLVKAYLARIQEVNLKGPALRAVIETNAFALTQAAVLDAERKITGKRSMLHGIPILIKDNIATIATEGMNTTAGSFALLGSVVPGDSGVVKRLRAAGAIILGKTNMSEFAGLRGNNGWSGRGGQTTSPYYPQANPCGSSSGSAVGAAIGLAAVTVGTETDGSIICPSSNNNIAGIKPTVGLTSRAGVVPLSQHQDTVGPLARSLTDAAIVLSIIAGKDSNDNFTSAQPSVVPDFTKSLNAKALAGKRIGVPRKVFLDNSVTGNDPSVNAAFTQALATLRALGATIVDPADLPSAEDYVTSYNETIVEAVDFKTQFAQYTAALRSNPSGVHTLDDLIAFNDANPSLEEPAGHEDQSLLIEAELLIGGQDATYYAALAADKDIGSTRGIDFVLKNFGLDALVLPAPGVNNPIGGGAGYTAGMAAIVGYPAVTVPMGFYPSTVSATSFSPGTVYPAPGVPFGLTFIGTAFSESTLIGFGYAYEQKTQTRLSRKAFAAAIPTTQLKDVMP